VLHVHSYVSCQWTEVIAVPYMLLADTRVLLMPHLAVGRNVSTEAIEKHGLGLVPVSFNHCSDQRLNYLTCTDSEK